MKKQKQLIYTLGLQTILAYLLSVLIINDSINMHTLWKTDIFLFLLIWIGLFFISSHFLFPIKKVYERLYQKRYFIAGIILLILVLGKFNGSSYGLWDAYIEPNYEVKELTPIIGRPRAERSDEWLVNSSYVLSQIKTGYHYFNPVMRATKTDVFATIPVPVANILGLTKPFVFSYIILGKDYGMSFYWFGRLIALFMITFELFMVLTKGQKISSLIGAILTTFSPPVFWWYSSQLVEMLIGGGFTILMFNQFLKAKTNKRKMIFSLLIAFGFLSYAFTLYPAWLIPFSYVYLFLAIYILIDTKENHQFKGKNLKLLSIPICIIIASLIYFFTKSHQTFTALMKTAYPGARFIKGGENYENLFSYPIALFFPYMNIGGSSCELSTFYSFFPFIVLIAIYELIKTRNKKKENILLLGITGLIIINLIFSFLSFPKFLAKITFYYMVPEKRLNVVTSFLCIILFTLLIDRIKIKTKKEKWILITILILSTIFSISAPFIFLQQKLSKKFMLISALLLSSASIFFLLKRKNILLIIITILSIATTIYINPVMKGFSALDQKPLAKELKKHQGEKATWLSLNSFVIPNYLGIEGMKTINTTNIIPNVKLWQKIDPKKKFEKIYNRYAHINIELTQKETKFELVQGDLFNLYLNTKDLCTLDVDYVTSSEKLEKYNQKEITLEKKYHKDNLYIYKTNCLGG